MVVMSDIPNWAEINPKIIDEFHANHGKLGGFFAGSPVLLLHTIGARSGKPRVTPLTYLPDGDSFVVFASNTGSPKHPAWFHNLVANPRVTVEVADNALPATATVAQGETREELFARQIAALPRYGGYQEKTQRAIPVVVITPTA
jgi:deazaflavin-dependent oxidoreductase (nitroreductase family)